MKKGQFLSDNSKSNFVYTVTLFAFQVRVWTWPYVIGMSFCVRMYIVTFGYESI